MTDDEFRGALGEAQDEIDFDHSTQDIPVFTALFTRTFPTYTETLWAHAYAGARCIVLSYPAIATQNGPLAHGVIRSIPIGWRDLASEKTFRARFEQIVASQTAMGWKRRPHTIQGS